MTFENKRIWIELYIEYNVYIIQTFYIVCRIYLYDQPACPVI